jgi:hypothetical protein
VIEIRLRVLFVSHLHHFSTELDRPHYFQQLLKYAVLTRVVLGPPFWRHQSPRTTTKKDGHSLRGWYPRAELSQAPDRDFYRTVAGIERSRYQDVGGVWQAVNPAASDPRVSTETANAYIPRFKSNPPPSSARVLSHIRPVSRGRSSTLSAQSAAEAELGRINRKSPPPARGGGMIQDQRHRRSRRPLSRTDNGGRLVIGVPYSDVSVHADTGYATSPSSERLSQGGKHAVAAQTSLQRIPHDGSSTVSPFRYHMLDEVPSPRQSPQNGYRQPYPDSATALYNLPGRWSQENLNSNYPQGIKRNSPDGIDNLHHSRPRTQFYQSTSVPGRQISTTSQYAQNSVATFAPNSTLSADIASGYTSQPMSRDLSAGSAGNISISSEPFSQPPTFSPQLGVTSTSYQGLTDAHHPTQSERWSRVLDRAPSRVALRSSSREAERQAKAPRLGNENTKMELPLRLRTRGLFNPTAPIFVPHENLNKRYPVPLPQDRYSTATEGSGSNTPTNMMRNTAQFVYPNTSTISPDEMAGGRIGGSGGFRIDGGREIIGFGDFPEAVDVLERRRYRHRMDEENMERERKSYRRWRQDECTRRRAISEGSSVDDLDGIGSADTIL